MRETDLGKARMPPDTVLPSFANKYLLPSGAGITTVGFRNKWVENTCHAYTNTITIFVNLGLFRHFETVINIRTWIKSHKYWRMW